MKKIIALLFTLMFLTACTETINKDYKFTGESENWEAEYIYRATEKWGEDNGTATYSNSASNNLVLRYKGSLKELASMKKLEYSYETTAGGGSKVETFDEPPQSLIFNSGTSSSVGGASISKDEVIQVIVKKDGIEETFDLKIENN